MRRHTARRQAIDAAGTLPVAKHIRNTDNIDNRNHRLGRPTRRPARRAARPHGGAMSELDLGREELRELATQVIAAAGDPTEPFGVYLFLPEQPESELPRSVERAVFDEFFGNSAELLDAEYRPYEDGVFFVRVLDQLRRLPAGMPRVGRPMGPPLKTFVDIEKMWGTKVEDLRATGSGADWVPEETWDSLTLGVERDYRGKATDGLISLGIFQTGTQSMRRCEARTTVAILDCNVLDLVQSMLADPYQRFDGLEPQVYLDSPASVPVLLDLAEWEPRLRAGAPPFHDIMFGGTGLEATVRPPEWAPLLDVDRSGGSATQAL